MFTELGAFAARGGPGSAPTGLAPVAAHQYIWEGNWNQQHLGADTYRTTSEVDARFRLRFDGTGVIAIAVIWFVARRLDIDPPAIWAQIRRANLALLAVAFVLWYGAIFGSLRRPVLVFGVARVALG